MISKKYKQENIKTYNRAPQSAVLQKTWPFTYGAPHLVQLPVWAYVVRGDTVLLSYMNDEGDVDTGWRTGRGIVLSTAVCIRASF